MNLTPRCIEMLPNHTQCSRDSVPPSPFCKLHIAFEEGKLVSPSHPDYDPALDPTLKDENKS